MISYYKMEVNMSFKEKSQIVFMVLAILLSSVVSFSILNVHGEDFPDYFVAGFVYINGEKTDGIEVILSVPGYENRSNISHYDADYDLHGLYKIGFYADQGQYADFTVKINDKCYIPNPSSLYIDKPHPYFYFNINLTVITENSPPSKPVNPSPIDGAVDVSITTSLSVDVYDPDGDSMNVYFYWDNGTMIGVDTNVPSGGTASIGPLSLSYDTQYYWYAIANDTQFENQSSTWSFTTQLYPINHPPSKPFNPTPSDESTNVSVNTDLSWQCNDPDGDPLTYDVYFGTTPNPPKVSNNQSSTTYDHGTLEYNTTYYWYVVAWDNKGAKNESNLWNFTTELFVNHPPDKPSNPSPANNSKNISINPTLSILVTDPDNDALDVYFYNALDDSLIGMVDNVLNGSVATIHWNGLDYNQTYFWYVIVNDSEFEVKSDTWNFKTIHEENQPPHVEIIKPVDAIYFRDRQITKFFLPIIVGKITIEANATDSDGTIERVEFIVDNVSRYNDTTEPYLWLWDERIFGFHSITVVAYDNDGRATEISKSILIINLHR